MSKTPLTSSHSPSKPLRRRTRRRRAVVTEQLETKMLLTSLDAFDSDAGLYQVYSNYGQTGQVNPADGTFQNTPARVGEKINAVGFRPKDQFAYGILSKSYELARVGEDGSHESLGLVDGLPLDKRTYFVGDFANDDLLWVRNGGEMNKLYGINVDDVRVEKTITTDANMTNIYDIAFNPVDEAFYASRRGTENTLTAITMDGKVRTVGQNGLQLLTFGAMYADAEGSVFGGANQTGDVYRFDTTTGKATWVAQGPASGTNDGFSNSTEVLELPPSALDDAFDTANVRKVTGNLFADNGGGSDIDGNNDRMQVVAVNENENTNTEVSLDSGAVVIVQKDGSFEYDSRGRFDTLAAGETATDTFTYTVADDSGLEDTATATIAVTGVGRVLGFETDWVRGLHHYGIRNRDVVLTNVGDINHDGFDDAAVSATKTKDGAGYTFVIYGSEQGISNKFDVQTMFEHTECTGDEPGVIFSGANRNDQAGRSISPAGDFNGDGIDDLLIAASDADPNGIRNSGSVYVIFGQDGCFNPQMNLDEIADSNGTQGFVLHGVSAHDLTGTAVASIGDFNNDGRDDIAIGASQADVQNKKNAGRTYVVYGTDDIFADNFALSDLLQSNGGDGSRGFVLNGTRKHDWAGSHVEGGVDLNGDGVHDMLVTAPNANADKLVNSGQSYVIYGRSNVEAEIDLGNLRRSNGNDGTFGYAISGSTRKTREGGYVRISDDLNGDGLADLTIGVGNTLTARRNTLYCVRQQGSEVRLVSLNDTQVYLDNFDQGNADYDGRDWDKYIHSATLHSSEGTSVTIWGDPHVVITIDGVTERFDIGYGEGEIVVDENTTIRWASKPYDKDNPDQQLPLDWFSVDTSGSDLDITVDADDGNDVADRLTGLTDAQLREFASQLREFAGLATEPLTRK